MIEVPWYMLSPSPYTLTVWSVLAIYQAKKLGASSLKERMYSFAISIFSLGLIVLPFDSLWVIFQSVKFGYLYPGEVYFTLFSSLFRNLLVFLLCVYETREIKDKLNIYCLIELFWFIPLFFVWFGLAPDPSWTDWTYAWRFGYGNQRTFLAFVISHGVMKIIQGIIFFDLWRIKPWMKNKRGIEIE